MHLITYVLNVSSVFFIRNPNSRIILEHFHQQNDKKWKQFFIQYWQESIFNWNSGQKSRWLCNWQNYQRILLTKKTSFYRSLRLFPFLRKNCSKTICPIFFHFAALLRIPWDLKLLKIAPICLPLSAKSRNETFLGINCMATGWGQTQMKGIMSWNRFWMRILFFCVFSRFTHQKFLPLWDHPFKTSANFHDFWPVPPYHWHSSKMLMKGIFDPYVL